MITIASVGSVLVDMTISVPRVPLTGENFPARGLHIGAGGKAANAAAAIARLGAHGVLIGKVGDDDFGRLIQSSLRTEGIDTAHVGVDPTAQTSVAFVLLNDNHENTIMVFMGANDRVDATYVDAALTPLLADLRAIIVDFEIPEAAVAATVQFGKQHHIPVVVDAGPPRPYAPITWRDAAVLTPNEHEAAAMVGYPVTTDEAALRAAAELLAHGPEVVLIKRGGAGALLMTRTETLIVPSFPVTPVDTTAAGDSFTAMFTLAMIEGKPLPEAVRWGNAAGALAVTKLGTMSSLPTRPEVEAFLIAHP